ncbi:MAG: deoxyguanosinetriphosphate triphosphohydrolase [Candidatus Omnitrophota bacterium]
MLKREDIESLEARMLSAYAMKSRDSAGREIDEPAHPIRTCYQRDRDRIVHSEAFRKLEYKTQVFVIIEGDYYRTRLTHTIEVAQIARTIGRSLQLNEDLIEAVALAHDLGHPPFGHAGEEALNTLMKDAGLPGFNHNFRSFEIVRKFEKRYPQFDGLNLTREVLVGILKHETTFDCRGAVEGFGEGPSLEAQVVDIADSLAYLNHDVDDGLTSGCIVEDDLIESSIWQRALQRIKSTVKDHNRQILKYQIVKELIDMQVKDLLESSDRRIKEAGFKSSAEVKAFKDRVVDFSPQMKEERRILQALIDLKFYHHYRVERMTTKARRIIQDLFHIYQKNPNQLPPWIYDRRKLNNGNDDKQICYCICNYIASMTDRYALDEHKKLFDPYTKV